MFIVTAEWIHAQKSARGGWTRAQLKLIGVSWPPRKGWILRVIGRQITDEQRQQFEQIRRDRPMQLALDRLTGFDEY